MQTRSVIEQWHAIVHSRDGNALKLLLADDVVFESPVVHTPQRGKNITFHYLAAAMQVLNNPAFRYLNEWVGPTSAVLEFQTECEGIIVNGVDIISWNDQGQISHFKVMVRPLKAITKLQEMMARLLQPASPA